MHKVVETVLTPPHPDPFEALLDEPFTGTFDHATAKRQSQVLVRGIVDVIAVPVQTCLQRGQGLLCYVGQAFYLRSPPQTGATIPGRHH
jgi:hypothetical protein